MSAHLKHYSLDLKFHHFSISNMTDNKLVSMKNIPVGILQLISSSLLFLPGTLKEL